MAEIGQVAHLLAFVVIANRRHTDLFEWGQRSRAFSLSAEIQQRLLPEARTCEAAAFTLAGWLEPAASIGGDTFDYSLARDLLHLSLTDAMGHGVGAALTASVCLGGLRGARRRGARCSSRPRRPTGPGSSTPSAAPRRLRHRAARPGGAARRHLEMVNAGHVAPYLLRGTDVTALDLPRTFPSGCSPRPPTAARVCILEPGDRFVFVTDGMLERNVGRQSTCRGTIRDTRISTPRARPCAGRHRARGRRPRPRGRRHRAVSGLAREARPGTSRRVGGRPRSRQRPTHLTTPLRAHSARRLNNGGSATRSTARCAARRDEPSPCVMLSGDNTGPECRDRRPRGPSVEPRFDAPSAESREFRLPGGRPAFHPARWAQPVEAVGRLPAGPHAKRARPQSDDAVRHLAVRRRLGCRRCSPTH